MRPPRLGLFAVFVCVPAIERAASFDDRVEALFRPPLGERVALSPDGQRVAYTSPRGSELTITIANVEPPGPRRIVKVESGREAAAAEGEPPGQLRFLRWATASRLVYAPAERVVPLPAVVDQQGRAVPNPDGPTIISPILAVDADGKERGALVDASYFQETPAEARRSLADLLRTTKELAVVRQESVRWRMPHLDILGIFPRDREQLIIGTRGAYSIPMQHLLDLRTGSVREFGGDWPVPPGEPQVFDWFRLTVVGERQAAAHPTTTWRDADLARVQQELARKFPRRSVELLDWSDNRLRVLCRVTGGSDPGRIFVYQRTEDLVWEIFHRAPWLSAAKLHDTRPFEFTVPDGARLSGYLTWPGKPRLMPPPLLVIFPSGFPGRAQPAFDPEAQVFADLGFAVARLNHRSVAGVRAEDRAALRAAVDRVTIDDGTAAIAWLAARYPDRPFDRKRVAALGRGFGGYLALRALQLQPAAFRGGIAIDAPVELRPWLRAAADGSGIPAALIAHEQADWKKLSVLHHAETLTQPVLLLDEPGAGPAIEGGAEELGARLIKLGRPAEQFALARGFAAARPAARAAAYRKIAMFLNQHLGDFAVTVGPANEVP